MKDSEEGTTRIVSSSDSATAIVLPEDIELHSNTLGIDELTQFVCNSS